MRWRVARLDAIDMNALCLGCRIVLDGEDMPASVVGGLGRVQGVRRPIGGDPGWKRAGRAILRQQLDALPELQRELVDGTLAVDRWPFRQS